MKATTGGKASRIATPLAISLALAFIALGSSCAQKPAELSGIVRAREYRLSSRLGGKVAQEMAQEGGELKAGEALARIDDSVLKAQREVLVQGAKAAWAAYNDLKAGATPEQLRQARAELAGAEAQYSQALKGFRSEDVRAAVEQRDALAANYDNAMKNAGRLENLFAEGVVSAKDRDAAVAARDALESQVAAAQANVDKLTRGLRPEEIAAAKAAADARQAVLDKLKAGATVNQLASAEARARQLDAQLAALDLDISDLTITAPTGGMLEEFLLDPGEVATPGQALATFVSSEDVWIDTFVPESMLSKAQQGAKMRVALDAFPGKPFDADIYFVSREAEFTPRNVSTPEERVNQVYRVKLRVQGAPVPLRSGMTAKVMFAS